MRPSLLFIKAKQGRRKSHTAQVFLSFPCYLLLTLLKQRSAVMAPKTTAAAEKKPAPAKKAVAKKSTAGRKKGSKKAVESYKIYIYKVSYVATTLCVIVASLCFSMVDLCCLLTSVL